MTHKRSKPANSKSPAPKSKPESSLAESRADLQERLFGQSTNLDPALSSQGEDDSIESRSVEEGSCADEEPLVQGVTIPITVPRVQLLASSTSGGVIDQKLSEISAQISAMAEDFKSTKILCKLDVERNFLDLVERATVACERLVGLLETEHHDRMKTRENAALTALSQRLGSQDNYEETHTVMGDISARSAATNTRPPGQGHRVKRILARLPMSSRTTSI